MMPTLLIIIHYVWLPAIVYAYVYGRRHGNRKRKLSAPLSVIQSKELLRSWEALSSPVSGNNDTINIYVRRGGHKLPIGSVKITDAEFEKNLMDFMADAESKAGIMNSSMVKWDGDFTEDSEVKRLKEKVATANDKATMWERRYQAEKETNQFLGASRRNSY